MDELELEALFEDDGDEVQEDPEPVALWWPISFAVTHGTTPIPFDGWLLWHADNAPALGHTKCQVRPLVISSLSA
jgi:hypothetical protein